MQRNRLFTICIMAMLLSVTSFAQSNDDKFNAYLQDINYYAQYGEHSKVIGLCQKALAINPASTEALNALGKSYFHTKQFALGATQFTKSLAADDDQTSCYYWRGKCYTELKQYPKALPDLRKAAELADLEGMGASDCYLALGDALYRQNPASAEAVQALEKAWQKEQYTASADTKAKIIDKYPEAAAKIWPDENIPTAAQKALAKQEQEKKEKAFYAEQDAKDAAKKKGEEVLDVKKKQYGKFYYEVTESDLKWAENRGALWVEDDAQKQLNNGNYVSAAYYYHIYYKMDTVRMWGLYGLAKVYYNAKDYKQCIYYINRCLDKKPGADWEATLTLQKADAYLKMKDYAACKKQIQPFLQTNDNRGGWAMMLQGQMLRDQKKPKTEYLPWFEKACAAGGDKRRWEIKQNEPAIYAALYPNEPNWEPKKQERNLTITKEAEPEPAKRSASNNSSGSSASKSQSGGGSDYTYRDCPTCNGGKKTFTTSCNICNGSGIIRYETKTETRQEGAYMRTITKKVPVACGKCDGIGKLVTECSQCFGRGSIMVKK